jgi:hypothetical protein
MRRSLAPAGLVVLVGLFVVGALVLPVAAGAATTHESFDVTGTVFPCPTHTYTITSGAINIVNHEWTPPASDISPRPKRPATSAS